MSQGISNQIKPYFMTKNKYHNGKTECEGVQRAEVRIAHPLIVFTQNVWGLNLLNVKSWLISFNLWMQKEM